MAERSHAETQKFLDLARKRFDQGQAATEKQRQRELDDLKFYAGGEYQWDAETLQARKAQPGGGPSGLPPVPARPVITINKVPEPIRQVLNQERQSDMGIQLVPADDWGELAPPVSEEEIELREGLVRRIQRESEAADARTWAFMRAAICGTGYYAVYVRYAPGKTWDKEIYVRRLFNQASVTFDPNHEQPDGSDCEWEFIGGDIPFERYKREYPRAANGAKNQTCAADDDTFRALGETYPGWFTGENDTKSARVVEYFYTDYEMRTLVQLVDGTVAWKDELTFDAELLADQIQDEREVQQKVIKWAKIDATQILEETDWEGPDMPIVKVVGEELQPWDGERRVQGMVRPARDAQRGYNAMVSKWVESVGLAPIPPLQIEETNIGSFGNWYQQLNIRPLSWIPFRARDDEGREIPPPTRSNTETPIQAIAASVQMFDEAIKSTTMVPSVQLGQATDAHIKSGKAIQALQDQAQLTTSHLLDNLRRSIRYEGQIENNLLYPIYGRPGRLARMLTGEGEPMSVRISAPMNGNRGQPYAQPGQGNQSQMVGASPPPGMGGSAPTGGLGAQSGAGPQGPPPKPPKTYTLTKDANFNVMVKVARSLDSRREQEASLVGNLIQAEPSLMTWFGDLMFKNQDGPGHDEMAERAEVMLDPKIQAMRASKEQGGMPVPPEAQAQLQQLKQQLDQAHQILQQAQQELKGKQHEQETKLQLEREKMDHAIKLQTMKDATQLAVARLTAANKVLDATHEDHEEALALAEQHAHETAMNELDHQQELEKAQMGHAHALEISQQPPPINPNQPQTGVGA